jgi:hypothetical protein
MLESAHFSSWSPPARTRSHGEFTWRLDQTPRLAVTPVGQGATNLQPAAAERFHALRRPPPSGQRRAVELAVVLQKFIEGCIATLHRSTQRKIYHGGNRLGNRRTLGQSRPALRRGYGTTTMERTPKMDSKHCSPGDDPINEQREILCEERLQPRRQGSPNSTLSDGRVSMELVGCGNRMCIVIAIKALDDPRPGGSRVHRDARQNTQEIYTTLRINGYSPSICIVAGPVRR